MLENKTTKILKYNLSNLRETSSIVKGRKAKVTRLPHDTSGHYVGDFSPPKVLSSVLYCNSVLALTIIMAIRKYPDGQPKGRDQSPKYWGEEGAQRSCHVQ